MYDTPVRYYVDKVGSGPSEKWGWEVEAGGKCGSMGITWYVYQISSILLYNLQFTLV